MKLKTITVLLLFACSSVAEQPKGTLIIIGGGKRPDSIIKEFVESSGGANANIVVIPNASSEPIEVGEYQVNQFLKFGAKTVTYHFFNREQAESDSLMNLFENVTGIFFSGGDQNRLTESLLESKVLERIKTIYSDGGTIGGTSAGAAVMSEIMITGDELIHHDAKEAFGYIQKNNIKTAEGFGFIKEAIIDQHFIYRKRHNRLISTVLEYPDLLGIGIDESTGIKVSSGNVAEVIGDYQVIIYDVSVSKNITDFNNGLLSAQNIVMHILSAGDKINLLTKKVSKCD